MATRRSSRSDTRGEVGAIAEDELVSEADDPETALIGRAPRPAGPGADRGAPGGTAGGAGAARVGGAFLQGDCRDNPDADRHGDVAPVPCPPLSGARRAGGGEGMTPQPSECDKVLLVQAELDGELDAAAAAALATAPKAGCPVCPASRRRYRARPRRDRREPLPRDAGCAAHPHPGGNRDRTWEAGTAPACERAVAPTGVAGPLPVSSVSAPRPVSASAQRAPRHWRFSLLSPPEAPGASPSRSSPVISARCSPATWRMSSRVTGTP